MEDNNQLSIAVALYNLEYYLYVLGINTMPIREYLGIRISIDFILDIDPHDLEFDYNAPLSVLCTYRENDADYNEKTIQNINRIKSYHKTGIAVSIYDGISNVLQFTTNLKQMDVTLHIVVLTNGIDEKQFALIRDLPKGMGGGNVIIYNMQDLYANIYEPIFAPSYRILPIPEAARIIFDLANGKISSLPIMYSTDIVARALIAHEKDIVEIHNDDGTIYWRHIVIQNPSNPKNMLFL